MQTVDLFCSLCEMKVGYACLHPGQTLAGAGSIVCDVCREKNEQHGGGYLLVGVDPETREVVLNLDRDRTGHLTFSPEQARGLANTLHRKADEAEVEPLPVSRYPLG